MNWRSAAWCATQAGVSTGLIAIAGVFLAWGDTTLGLVVTELGVAGLVLSWALSVLYNATRNGP